jgi:hypothetical protein
MLSRKRLLNTAARKSSTPIRVEVTSTEFTSVLINNGISISMDRTGAWRDNVFKYEEVYLHAYEDVAEARRSIARYIEKITPDSAPQPLSRTSFPDLPGSPLPCERI